MIVVYCLSSSALWDQKKAGSSLMVLGSFFDLGVELARCCSHSSHLTVYLHVHVGPKQCPQVSCNLNVNCPTALHECSGLDKPKVVFLTGAMAFCPGHTHQLLGCSCGSIMSASSAIVWLPVRCLRML